MNLALADTVRAYDHEVTRSAVGEMRRSRRPSGQRVDCIEFIFLVLVPLFGEEALQAERSPHIDRAWPIGEQAIYRVGMRNLQLLDNLATPPDLQLGRAWWPHLHQPDIVRP